MLTVIGERGLQLGLGNHRFQSVGELEKTKILLGTTALYQPFLFLIYSCANVFKFHSYLLLFQKKLYQFYSYLLRVLDQVYKSEPESSNNLVPH